MSGLKFNKIIASIIIAIIIFIIIGFIGNYLVTIDHPKNQETAYKIDIPEKNNGIAIKTASSGVLVKDITSLLASGSLKKGEKIFNKCGTCHNYKKYSKSKIGPNLWNLINRPKANISGFAYSKALVDYGGKWTFEELNKFLYKPKEYIKGTKMNFAGLNNIEDRTDLILWLRQQSDNPVSLPE